MANFKYYLNNLDSSGDQIFPLFLLAPKLAKIFGDLLKVWSFLACWIIANITTTPKGSSPTQLPSDCGHISITPVLSKTFERLIALRLYFFH